jgi:hypothetical protein
MAIDVARRQQFHAFGQIERIAVPVQHRHAFDMAQRAVPGVDADRMEAHSRAPPG